MYRTQLHVCWFFVFIAQTSCVAWPDVSPRPQSQVTSVRDQAACNRDRPAGCDDEIDGSEVQIWHPLTISLKGPLTSETTTPNPFTDFRIIAEFFHQEHSYTVRGYFAADGAADETGAEAGDTWRVKFTPDRLGAWTYRIRMETGDMIALAPPDKRGAPISVEGAIGAFMVTPSDKVSPDFRAIGRLAVEDGYFKTQGSAGYWLKGGANSPENLLAYEEFDGTYRIKEASRDGEAKAGRTLHQFSAHVSDWRKGHPVWKGDKGKGLIGAINYLASTGMNAVYFLTMNIDGDGDDIWPYRDPDDFTRFDVSKLAQWDIVFSHMQAKGVLLHIVMQETENELLFDGGDTGVHRRLYLNELIARFAHHPGLVWNLGEENGPVHWRPEGQTTEQRLAMIAYLETADPYDHPVVLHTHAEAADKDAILSPLLGVEALDGLSFQVADRKTVNAEVRKWRHLSDDAGTPWVISMDEIGPWDIGAKPDAVDPKHETLTRHALWGALLGGAGGVEWYFGANQPGNDLTSEDWRQRDRLWRQTKIALDFFEASLPYWEMRPCEGVPYYCLTDGGRTIATYVTANSWDKVELALTPGTYKVAWLDPFKGGSLQKGATIKVGATHRTSIGTPPDPQTDWVVLVTKN